MIDFVKLLGGWINDMDIVVSAVKRSVFIPAREDKGVQGKKAANHRRFVWTGARYDDARMQAGSDLCELSV